MSVVYSCTVMLRLSETITYSRSLFLFWIIHGDHCQTQHRKQYALNFTQLPWFQSCLPLKVLRGIHRYAYLPPYMAASYLLLQNTIISSIEVRYAGLVLQYQKMIHNRRKLRCNQCLLAHPSC